MTDKNDKRGPFLFAWQGIMHVFKTERNMRIHAVAAILAILMGLFLKIDQMEWALIIIVIGLVMAAEMINTCVELIMDHLCPQYHIATKHVKDVAAGAVLFAAFTAVITGLLIFIPKLSAFVN